MDKFSNFNDFDLQVILYSKDWYMKTEVFADLKVLIGKIAGLDVKHITDLDVLQQVAGTMHKIWSCSQGPTNWDMEVLYKDTWLVRFWNLKESITMKDHLDSLLRVIHMKRVDTFPKLPAPSPEYLPLKDEDALSRWKKLEEPFTPAELADM